MLSVNFAKMKFPLVLFILFSLFACKDRMMEYYEKPEWLEGSIWDVLSAGKDGKSYSTFLKGAELAGFRPYLEGKGILTVMAPDNEAFNAYLSEHGYGTIEEMGKTKPDELKKLIGFHLLYYAYTKRMMENFRPEGQGAGGLNEILDNGMYYKFRTRSSSPTTQELDASTQKKVTVYHLERFIPVFSHNFFASKKIDAKRNYEFFYPNSTWKGDAGFNVSGAGIVQYELIANNGYVYIIDKVLEPLETIYEELKKNPDYSDFLELYNANSYYEYDATLSLDYAASAGVDSLFLHKHREPLPPIALEWPVSNYRDLGILASQSYSVFAPTNRAFDAFFATYWRNSGYTSLKTLDPLILKILLNEYVYGGSAVFPDEIVSKSIVSSFGTVYNFDPYKATHRKMCVNGSFYGLDEITGPGLFSTVAGPGFQNKNYLNFLYALNTSGLLNSLGAAQKYTVLVPKNDAFTGSGYSLVLNPEGNYLAQESPDGLVAVPSNILTNIVNAHTVIGEVNVHTTGTQVLPNVIPYNYLYVKNGKITSSSNFNRILEPNNIDPFVSFQQITNNGSSWSNGKVYTYEGTQGLFESTAEADPLKKVLANNNDNRFPYFAFAQLLKKAGLVSGDNILGVSGRFIAFIPTNAAIYQALSDNAIPGITNGTLSSNGTWTGTFNTTTLKNYLYNYFITAAQITTAPYPGSEMQSGEYFTYAGSYLVYTDNLSSLSIRLKGSSKVCPVSPAYNYFPFAYSDGSFHFIDSILQ